MKRRYAIDSSVWTGETIRSTISFRSVSIFHAGSSAGTFWPTRKGKNLKLQFSWEFPPIVFRDATFNGTGWGQFTLSVHLKGKCCIDSFKYASVKYFLDVKTDRQTQGYLYGNNPFESIMDQIWGETSSNFEMTEFLREDTSLLNATETVQRFFCGFEMV